VRPPSDRHAWLALEDPEQNATWMFDLSFLRSGYECVYGRGCQSIHPEPSAPDSFGCCIHGAHMVDDEDRETVQHFIDQLEPDEWQFHGRAQAKGGALKQKGNGDWVTRKVDGACIMLNRDGFAGGAGCALHQAAVRRGERALDWKPDVCWQVPLHLDILENEYGHETILVRAWNRHDWGPGGEDFHWWCIENDDPYRGQQAVYRSHRDELIEMVGEGIYRRLVEAVESQEADERRAGLTSSETPVALG
jgi:hypothetical protein